jgi:SAM-dependent methyltransferase
MTLNEATALIRNPTFQMEHPQSWCDLGCGSGTFTVALAQSLTSGSTIHAVDLDQGVLDGILDRYHGVAIRKVLGDLRSPSLRLPSVDGILMANSLHFIQDQHVLLKKLLPATKCFLIVEYERSKPSRWVPYPVGFEKLFQLFNALGIQNVEKVATRRSRFGGTMYSALAKQP